MKKIAVTGGKGGTGKSTVATSLANEMKKYGSVLLVDADVDCPNDHLILNIAREKVKDVENMIPEIDQDRCTKCGICSEVCRENAIVQVKDKYPFVVPDQCTGCKSCEIACPVDAISESKQIIGSVLEGTGDVDLISGEMKPGIEESSLIVNSLKDYLEEIESGYDYVIIDTAAGTHCPVIAALSGVDLAIAVTEPTPLGDHDLDLILRLLSDLRINSKVVVNRSDISKKGQVEQTTESHEAALIGQIPYSKEIESKYSKGEPIDHPTINKIARGLK